MFIFSQRGFSQLDCVSGDACSLDLDEVECSNIGRNRSGEVISPNCVFCMPHPFPSQSALILARQADTMELRSEAATWSDNQSLPGIYHALSLILPLYPSKIQSPVAGCSVVRGSDPARSLAGLMQASLTFPEKPPRRMPPAVLPSHDSRHSSNTSRSSSLRRQH